MRIRLIEMAGMAAALTALRLPFGKEERSSIVTDKSWTPRVVENGEDILPTFYTCTDIGIHPKDLDLLNALVKRGPEHSKVTRGIIVWVEITAPIYWWCEMETYVVGHQRLSSESTMHIDCKGLTGDDLVKAKAEIPMGKELTKVDAFSYQALRNIVRQRHNHRLPEWHSFVDWVKMLPFADELILDGLDLEEED